MHENRKKRLVDLGAEALAEALLDLASQDDAADDLVERMIASPKENIVRFKAKLASLKRSRRFVEWDESDAFAQELETLLQDLRAGVDDPQEGAELVAAFIETDNWIFENCDDSSGYVGNVYSFNARDLFDDYARLCPDKEWLADLVFKLNLENDYGVRDTLIDGVAEYLPEPNIRALIDRLQETADKEKDGYDKRHSLSLIESLARQIGDARLFEKTRLAPGEKPSITDCMEIARVYLEIGDANTALSWMEKIPEDEIYQANDRDRLLLTIFGLLGETQQQQDIAWRIFHRYRSKDSLEELLSVIGEEQREAVIKAEAGSILSDKTLSLTNAAFLKDIGLMEETERYLMERVDQLNGDYYGRLLPLAEAMEADARQLAATVVYRALIDSILQRGQSKAYPHGARYLKKLDKLAKSIANWRNLDDHDAYLQQLRTSHGRKYSFWPQYEN